MPTITAESLQEYFLTAITTDSEMLALAEDRDPADWFFEMSSLGLGPTMPVPKRWYMIWKENSDLVHQEVRETSDSRNRNFQFFVYDYKGTFDRIENVLKRLRKIVKDMAPFETTDGMRCSASLFGGTSGQIQDDGYDSCCKYIFVSFTVSE